MRHPLLVYTHARLCAFVSFTTENCNSKDGHNLTVMTSNPLGPHSYDSEDYVHSITMFMTYDKHITTFVTFMILTSVVVFTSVAMFMNS